MTSAAAANFERMLEAGKENSLLRFSLGNEYLKSGDPNTAVTHLERAVELDADFSAAWKLLGAALTQSGRTDAALAAYERGIAVAERKGDKQAAKEMAVFARRLKKQL
jgi:predicted Zn-dependent protease